MLFRSVGLIILAASAVFQATVAQDPKAQLRHLLHAQNSKARHSLSSHSRCTPEKLVVRREWGDMSSAQRKDYIRAVHCLKRLPSRTSRKTAPGARSRHDDFVVAHSLNALKWHFSPWLLLAHRYFIWQMEQALRNECGYKGGLPYWAWERYEGIPLEQTPLFDGSPASLSGNGVHTHGPHGCNCVRHGPFAHWTVTLGPSGGGIGCKQNPRPDGMGYNPRCLERQFDSANMQNMTYRNIVDVIRNSHDINTFGLAIEDWSGIHGNPHTAIGGLQMDIPGSPSDHAFFHHHCGIDRMFALWQAIDPARRRGQVASAGPYQYMRRIRNWPPAQGIHPDDMIHLSRVFPDLRVRHAGSTTGGPFCYVYA